MNRTALILTLLAAAVVIGAAAIVVAYPSSGPDPEDDYIGHWYTVDCKKYNSFGAYIHTDVSNAPIYDLDIYKVENDIFYGWYDGNNVCGTLFDGKISYSTYDPSGIKAVANGVFVDGCMRASSVYYLSEGPTDRVGVINILLSRDYTCTKTLPDLEDIRGVWNQFDGVMYDGDVLPLSTVSELTVDGQEGTMFKGSIQLPLGDTVEDYSIRGAFYDFEDGSVIGTMVDKRGNFCNAHLKDGVLTFETLREFEPVADGDGMKVGAVRRSYSQDPGAEYKPFAVNEDLVGSSWRSVKVEVTDTEGNVTSEGTRSFLDVLGDYENYLYCVETASDISIPIVVMYHDDRGAIRVINTVSGDKYAYTDIRFVDEDHFVIYIAYDTGSDMLVQARHFERYAEDTTHDLTGHWYASQRAGYDEDGNYVLKTLAEDDMSGYDLDIYVDNDGLFRGWYMGRYVAGYCDGTTIAFMDPTDGDKYYISGEVENSNSISLNEAHYGSDTGAVSGYTTYFTKDRGAILTQPIELDLTGSWTMSSGIVCYESETVELEKPQRLDVFSTVDGVFIGTMDVKGPSEISSVDIRGVMLPGLSSKTVRGFIVDGEGGLWFSQFTASTLYMTRANVSVNPLHDGEISVIEKVFTPDGRIAVVEVPTMDVIGKWHADEVHMMCADGTYVSEKVNYTLNVDSQLRNMAMGTCTYGTLLAGTFSVTMQYSESAVLLNSGVDFSGSADIGIGTLIDEGHMVIVESFIDADGKLWMQKTLFERQYYT